MQISAILRFGIALLLGVTLVPAFAQAQSLYTPERIEQVVTKYFASSPEMIAIAKCESGFRQFYGDGSVLRGGTDGGMIGIYQLHETYHRSAAKVMGLDIDTVLGNIGYARHLYQSEGVAPWLSSAECWQGQVASVSTATPVASATADTPGAALANAPVDTTLPLQLSKKLTFGMYHEEVRTLQKILNRIGYRVAKEGPGSKGEETAIFGQLTKKALLKFQCKKDIACERGDGEYGVVGPKTRRALNKYAGRISML